MSEIKLLKLERNEDREVVEHRVRASLDSMGGNIAGFALVIWGEDHASVAVLGCNKKSRIPSILIPDFARNRLLAEKIEEWIVEDLSKPPTKEGA